MAFCALHYLVGRHMKTMGQSPMITTMMKKNVRNMQIFLDSMTRHYLYFVSNIISVIQKKYLNVKC